MARKRVIDPDFWIDEQIAELPFEGRLLYIGLWNFADDQGVLPYKPKQIRAQVFPYDPDLDIDGLLDRLIAIGKLVLYEAEGSEYLYLKNFSRHQTIKRPTYKYPVPPMASTCSEHVPNKDGMDGEHVLLKRKEEKRKEGKGSIHDTGIITPNGNSNTNVDITPPPPSPSTSGLDSKEVAAGEKEEPRRREPVTVAGWEATDESREAAWGVVRRLEERFGVWPFTSRQQGNGQQAQAMERLAAACRILDPEEIIALVGEEYERKRRETKGVDAPTHLPYYLPHIAEAARARDRELAEQERRREEAKRARAGPGNEGPVEMAGLMEELKEELTPEEVKARFAAVKARIRGSSVQSEARKEVGA